jgi:hypothetical protein
VRAAAPRIRFHDLRHTAATLLLGRGVHPKIVSEMLGHSTIAITLDKYSHVTPTMQPEAAAATAMDAVLARDATRLGPMDDLDRALLTHLTSKPGGPFLISGNLLYIGRGHWHSAVEWFRSQSAEVLGFEGFDIDFADDKYVQPRLDYIADFEGLTGVDALAQTALRLLTEWEAATDCPRFIVFTASVPD